MHEIVTLGKTHVIRKRGRRVNAKVVPAHNTLSYNVVDILCLSVLFKTFFRQDLCTEWAKKPKEEQSFEAFHRAVSAAAAHQYGRTKYKVNTLMVVSIELSWVA